MILTIALGTWMLNAYPQEVSESKSSQSIASLLNEQPEKEKKKSVQSLTIGGGPAWISSKVYTPRDVYTSRSGIEMMAEYEEVLSRTHFHISTLKRQNLFEYIRQKGIAVERVSVDTLFIDESDRVFYEVTLSKEDSFLVTGNLKHFPIDPRVVTPAQMLQILGEE